MDDLYSALIEGMPTDRDRQAALARALRNRNTLGDLAMATGDRVMAPLGKNLEASSAEGAQELARQRDIDAQRQQQQAQFQQEQAFRQQQLGQQMKIAEMTDARQRELARLLANNRLAVQDDKNKGKTAKPMPQAAAKEMEAYQDALEGVNNALATYKPGFSKVGTSTENWIAQHSGGMSPDSWKEANNWWQNYGRLFTLPEMHNLFGARISPTERQMFEQVHIGTGMGDEQIMKNLPQIRDMILHKMQRRASDYASQGYDVGNYSNLSGTGTPAAAAAPSPGQKYLNAARAGAGPSTAQMPVSRQPGVAPQPGSAPAATLLQQALGNRLVSPLLGGGNGSLFTGLGGLNGP